MARYAKQPVSSIKPSSSRRERHRAETRDRIFRAALRLFAERGFLETTVEDITDAADVGKGTFFNYFPTKEHVLSSFGDQRLAVIERALEESKQAPLLSVLREAVADLARQSSDTPALLRAIFAAHAACEPVRAKLQDRLTIARRLFAEMFERAQNRGEVRADISAEQLGRLVHFIFFEATLAWSMNPDSSLAETVDEIWQLISPGLAPREPSPEGAGLQR